VLERLKQDLEVWASPEGLRTTDMLDMPEPLRPILQTIMRRGSITIDELADELGCGPAEADEIADLLVSCGFLRTHDTQDDGHTVFRVRLARTRRRTPAAIWSTLLDDQEGSS